MDVLRNKTILILSPQSWGKMLVSKHHYAIALAKRGNRVFFLNPPDQQKTDRKEKIAIKPSSVDANLMLIDHRLGFPYNIKFHWIGLFHLLMRSHVSAILRRIGGKVDIVWSFDLGNLYPFSFFPKSSLKVFHPVDEPLNPAAIRSGKNAQVIFSVTKEILDKYAAYPCPRYFINHGLTEEFLKVLGNGVGKGTDGVGADDVDLASQARLRVGMAGNLLRGDLDRPTLLRIIRDHPDIQFEAWGAYQVSDSNIGAREDAETRAFIQDLFTLPNLILHGPVSPSSLATGFGGMDAFLICYDVQKDQSKGTNYHKLIEYLSTGKVVVSNNVTTYAAEPDLVQMVMERDHNDTLPGLFKRIVAGIDRYNTPVLSQKRRAFALDNTYPKQVDRIEKILATIR